MTSKASSYTPKCICSNPESVGWALALSSDMRPHFILGSRGVRLLALSAQAALRAGELASWQSTCPGSLCTVLHLGVPTRAFIKANLIIFHCVFLKGCYDFLDVWWLVINQAFMMSFERLPLGLPPTAVID